MTLASFRDHVESMDSLQAERMLVAAQSAAYPHMKERSRDSWHRELSRRATRRQRHAAAGSSPFRVGGVPVSIAGFKRAATTNLGGGFRED